MTEPEPQATDDPRYRYHTGVTAIPSTGAAVPICRVGPGGCQIQLASSAPGIFIGGPDVTTANGFPFSSTSPVFVPSTTPVPPPVVGAAPEPVPQLYACGTRAGTMYWLSGQA